MTVQAKGTNFDETLLWVDWLSAQQKKTITEYQCVSILKMLGNIGSKKLLDSCRKVVIASETSDTPVGASIRKAQEAFREIKGNDSIETNSVLFQLANDLKISELSQVSIGQIVKLEKAAQKTALTSRNSDIVQHLKENSSTLEELTLEGPGDFALDQWPPLPSLKLICFSSTDVTNSDIQILSKLAGNSLERLYLEFCKNFSSFEGCAPLPQLHTLNCRGSNLTEEGFQPLSRSNTTLKDLDVSGTGVTLKDKVKCKLEELNISGCKVSTLVTMDVKNLQQLWAGSTDLSDKDLKHLADKADVLKSISLTNCKKITRLSGITLKDKLILDVSGTAISQDEVKTWKKANPNVWIYSNK